MSFHLPEPDIDSAVDQLSRFEQVASVPPFISDCISTRRLSFLVRSLNLLLERPEYQSRARSAISRLGFPLDS
jgi:hypothetical protein